jgi:hypothetical protein
MLLEGLNELGKIRQGSRQAIDLVDDYNVYPACLDISHELLETRPVDIAARETTIIVRGLDEAPALMGLRLHISLAGFALGVE